MDLYVSDIIYERNSAGEPYMLLIGRDRQGVKHRACVKNPVFYVHLALDHDTSLHQVEDIGNRLAAKLPSKLPCQRTKCECKPKLPDVMKVPLEQFEFMNSNPCANTYTSFNAYVGCDIVYKKGFCGYEPEPRPFAVFKFAHFELVRESIRYLKYLYKNKTLPEHLRGVYGDDVSAALGFYDRLVASSFMWFRLPALKCTLEDIIVLRDDKTIVEQVSYGFDIEALPKLHKKHTDPCLDIHPIISIAIYNAKESVVFAYKDCGPCKVNLRLCRDEKHMLEEFFAFVRDKDPDELYGFNICKYDIPYIEIRANRLGVTERWVAGAPLRYSHSQIETQQLGTIDTCTVHVPGLIFYDIFVMAINTMKLSKNNLDAVTYHVLGRKGKKELPHQRIFDHFNGTSEQLAFLYEYNLADAVACMDIAETMLLSLRMQKSCFIKGIDARASLERRNTFHGYSICSRFARETHLFPFKSGDSVVPSFSIVEGFENMVQNMRDKISYEGAFVIDPHIGFSFFPQSIVDANSLYPSSIIAGNLCHTTLLTGMHKYKREWPIDMTKNYIGASGHEFTREVVGIIPQVCMMLISERKKVKAQLENPDLTPIQINALNAYSQELKLSANSLYGATGSTTGRLSCPPVARCTTGLGREVLMTGISFIEHMHEPGFGVEGERRMLRDAYPQAEVLLYSGAVVMYGDTDSLMVAYRNMDFEASIEAGEALLYAINNLLGLPPSIRFSLESKCIMSVYAAMKRYVYLLAQGDETFLSTLRDGKGKIKKTFKGLEIVRRDFFPYLTDVMQSVFDLILTPDMLDETKRGAILDNVMQVVQDMLSDLLHGKVSNDKLLLTCNISKNINEYKSDNLAQVTIAKQLIAAGMGVDPGTRVAFFYHGTSSMKSENVIAEDLVDDDFKPNYLAYFEKMSKPLWRILELVIGTECAEYVMNPDRYMKTQFSMQTYFGKKKPIPKVPPIQYVKRFEKENTDQRIDGVDEPMPAAPKKKRKIKQPVQSGDITEIFKKIV